MQITRLDEEMIIYCGGFEFLGQFSDTTQTDALQLFFSVVEQLRERIASSLEYDDVYMCIQRERIGLQPVRYHREPIKYRYFARQTAA